MNEKLENLKKILKDLKKVLIAYSGGVDSTFLLKVAVDTLGKENVLAVTATSPTYTPEELELAKEFTHELEVEHLVIKSHEFDDPNFVKNPPNRCYFCKKELFSKLKALAEDKVVIDASNIDDLSDYRPGTKAKEELGIKSPLQMAKITKDEIRALSKEMGLKTFDHPAMACLSSRIPYGEEIKEETLKKIYEGEKFIRSLGFKNVRLRHHQSIARIEIAKDEMDNFSEDMADKIDNKLKELGYLYITLDLAGYQMGSMNETLKD